MTTEIFGFRLWLSVVGKLIKVGFRLCDEKFPNKEAQIKTQTMKKSIDIYYFVLIRYDADAKKSNKLENNLVELGTGEGKSITFGVTCTTLALLDFEVYCVCYSQYLSDRDFNAFKALFDCFDLADKVVYGTFSKICENFINERGDLRALIKNFFLTGMI